MNKLETVVRPFQLGDVFTARTLAPELPSFILLDPIAIVWGNQISLMAKQNGIPDLNTGGKHWSEVERSTATVRVHNPNDSNQFVDVERIRSMRFKDELGMDHFLKINN
jgi:hypothetical protein